MSNFQSQGNNKYRITYQYYTIVCSDQRLSHFVILATVTVVFKQYLANVKKYCWHLHVQAIKGNNPNDVDSCFTSLITHWLEGDTEVQWESLIEALRSPAIHRIDLIQNVEAVRNEAV